MNKTDICNMALSMITRVRINSLEEDREEAKECAIYYEHTRKRLLTFYDWGFARRVTKLALRTNSIAGWEYCYGYPQECLLVRFVFDELHAAKKEMERQDFQIITITGNDKAILSNTEEAWVEYVADVKETEMFSEGFVDALARSLAAELAFPLTGNSNLANLQLQLANQSIAMAMQGSVTEQERRTMYPTKYANARFS